MTLGVKPGSGLDHQMENGQFVLPSETKMISEQRLLLEHLEGITRHYANHHSVDLLLEVLGQFPMDEAYLLSILNRFLSLNKNDQLNFIMGRRLGYYRQLSDMENDLQYRFVEKQVQKIKPNDSFKEIFHNLRRQVI